MTTRGLAYAEETLGVHTVYTEAIALRENFARLQNELLKRRSDRRMAEDVNASREMDLTIEHRGRHPEMSEAAFGRHMKVVLHQDAQIQAGRDTLSGVEINIDRLQTDLRLVEIDLKVSVARLEELGGYFVYLAALKNAETCQDKPTVRLKPAVNNSSEGEKT